MRVQEVVKSYGRADPVLAGVDLEVPAAAKIQVVGGNGAGKSTLLRIVAGVSRPTSGMILDRPQVVGYVPQTGGAGLMLSPHAYLTHLGRVRGLHGGAAQARAVCLLDQLGVAGGRDAALGTASGGTRRKVVIAQAFLLAPGLVVLDEPFDGLDTATTAVLTAMLTQAAAGGASVVFTDHRDLAPSPGVVVHELVGGRLTARTTGVVTIVLVSGPELVDPGSAWAKASGVIAETSTEDGVRLRVRTENCDQVLVAALANGWSVRQVTPEAWAP